MTSLITLVEALDRGWSIAPINADKKACIAWKPYQATRPQESDLILWIHDFDPPAWAVITGEISGIVVLDFDGEAGRQTMERYGIKPHVRTPSGGYHAYFKHPGWPVPTLNGKSKLELGQRFPGLDIRADGGYAGFSGTTAVGAYELLRDPIPDDLSILPDDLREYLGLLHPPVTTPRPEPLRTNACYDSRQVKEGKLIEWALNGVRADGHRNNWGFQLACQLRDNRYARSEAESVIRDYRARCPEVNSKGQREAYTEREMLNSLSKAYEVSPREPWGNSTSGSSRIVC